MTTADHTRADKRDNQGADMTTADHIVGCVYCPNCHALIGPDQAGVVAEKDAEIARLLKRIADFDSDRSETLMAAQTLTQEQINATIERYKCQTKKD